jgi:hypothetical protein
MQVSKVFMTPRMLPVSGYAVFAEAKGLVYREMSFTLEDLDRLSSQSPGWLDVRARLWVALDERLHGMVLNGVPADSASWSLRPRFNVLLDVERGQDFICEFISGLLKKADKGSLLLDFKGDPDKVLAFLAAPDLVAKRALDHAARHTRVGMVGMPRDKARAPRITSIDSREGASEDLVDRSGREVTDASVVGRIPIEIEWDPDNGVDARVRMAALQCWLRLDDAQIGLELLRRDLKDAIRHEPDVDPWDHLGMHHARARVRLLDAIEKIGRTIHETPGMHERTRAGHDGRRVSLEVDLLLCPLDRESIQDLLELPSSQAAYKQLSRYRKSFPELFPGLQAHLQGQEVQA